MEKIKKTTTKNIYNYFLSKEHEPLKAMGLCYFAYSWGLVFFGCEIAPFRFLKSGLGPIDASVSDMLETVPDQDALLSIADNRLILDYLYFVWSKYRNYTGEELLARAKKQPPYLKAAKAIKKKDIKRFFGIFSKT